MLTAQVLIAFGIVFFFFNLLTVWMPGLVTRLYDGQPEHSISSHMPYLGGGMFCALPVHVKYAIIWLQSPDDYVPSVLYSNIVLKVEEADEERFYEAFFVYLTQPNCFLLWQCFGQNLIFIVMCMFVSSQRFWVKRLAANFVNVNS